MKTEPCEFLSGRKGLLRKERPVDANECQNLTWSRSTQEILREKRKCVFTVLIQSKRAH